jgi:glucose/arabinose dehydrogenase
MRVCVRSWAAIAGVLGMASVAAATAAQANSRFSPTTGFHEPDGTRWGRPVDAVPGPDGGLYVSDDQAGVIYRLVPPS